MRYAILLAAAVALAIAAIAPASLAADPGGAEPASPEAPIPLVPGATARGAISTGEGEPHERTYRFEVGPDAVALRVELDAAADLDLRLAEPPAGDRRGGRPKPVAAAEEATGTERLVLDRAMDPPLRPGPYWVTVVWPERRRNEPPRAASGAKLAAISYRLRVVEIRAREDGVLFPGVAVRSEVGPALGWFRTYVVDVPPGAACLRLDLSEAPGDLTLRARRGRPILDPADADATADSPLGTEVLVLTPEGDPPLTPGRWYVDVHDDAGLDFPIPFTLRASFSAAPDPALLVLPHPPAPRTALERALYSTVELLDDEGGGSGVVIGERGLILTNYHVVQDKVESRGEIGSPLVVALTVDPRDPPHEAFRARVVTASAELDLALVEATSGLYGQPIPPDYRFVTASLGDPARLTLGAPLYAVGYPSAGGSGTRVSVTLTRGVVAGFERRGETLHIKTDCMINSGNSGGSALDERFEVIGLPTETISDEDTHGQIAYVRPLWLVPRAWWALADLVPPATAPGAAAATGH